MNTSEFSPQQLLTLFRPHLGKAPEWQTVDKRIAAVLPLGSENLSGILWIKHFANQSSQTTNFIFLGHPQPDSIQKSFTTGYRYELPGVKAINRVLPVGAQQHVFVQTISGDMTASEVHLFGKSDDFQEGSLRIEQLSANLASLHQQPMRISSAHKSRPIDQEVFLNELRRLSSIAQNLLVLAWPVLQTGDAAAAKKSPKNSDPEDNITKR